MKRLVIILFILFACTRLTDEYRQIIVYKDSHSSGYTVKEANKVEYTFQFTENSRYLTDIKENQHDKNKILGLSAAKVVHLFVTDLVVPLGNIHKNSCRVGWWFDPVIELYEVTSYVYIGSKVVKYSYGWFGEHEDIYVKIEDKTEYWEMTINTHVEKFPKKPSINHVTDILYIGGDEVAHKDISILIKN